MKNNKLSILIVGDFFSPIHEKAYSQAFSYLGHEVVEFKITSYFKDRKSFLSKIQDQFQIGPNIYKLNSSLKEILKKEFDFIFLYRPRLIWQSTLRNNNSLIFIYNNDDPFSPSYNWYFWRNFFKVLKFSNHIFSYRERNILEYKKIGYENVSLLRSCYIKKHNFPFKTAYKYDVIFIGHFENDSRDYKIKYLFENGINIKVFGPNWNRSKFYSLFLKNNILEGSLNIEDYNKKLNQSKLALVFFSKLNRDQYTRRCFEIPATLTPMICEENNEILTLFRKDEEIKVFRNKEELLYQINYLLMNHKERDKIAKNAFKRLLLDKHEIKDRAVNVISIYNKL